MSEVCMEKDVQRLEVLSKIKELERLGRFDEDAEEEFDVNAFFNEMNPTINDAGFGSGFVPDEDNM